MSRVNYILSQIYDKIIISRRIKYMSKEEFNKISFNNFKPFGAKMQTFTQKPITLIYGPNSTGKSSLLHSILYYEYIKIKSDASKAPIDNYTWEKTKTHLFGDELDLGQFENFIHGHDLKAHIQYSTTIQKDEDIAKILSPYYLKIKKFKDTGVFDMIEELDGLRVYRQKENTYYMHSVHKLRYNYEKILIKDIFIKNNTFSPNDNIDAIFEETLVSSKNLSDICYREDGVTLDTLDKFILFLMDNSNNTAKFFSFKEDLLEVNFSTYLSIFRKEISFCKYFSNISTLKIEREVFHSEDEQGFLNQNKLYINNDLLYTVAYKKNKILNEFHFKIKKNHPFFKSIINDKINIQNKFSKLRIVNSKYILNINNLDIFIHHRYLTNGLKVEDYLEDMVFHLSKKVFYSGVDKNSQYIGPLRWLPGRDDLLQESDYKIDKNKIFGLSDCHNEMLSQVIATIVRFQKIFRKFKILKWPLIAFFLIYCIIKNSPKLIFSLFNSVYTADYFNQFKDNKDKVSFGEAKTTEKMWEEIIASQSIRDKLNNWLGDDTKLKSTYEIIVEEHKKKNSSIKRLFGKKEHLVKVLSFVDKKSETKVSIKDMGLGVSQVLPVLFSCFTKKKTKIFLEQPELHLHPKIQADLADEFIRSYKDKEHGNEFLIETHSEHLLLRIMKRMRYTVENRKGRDKTLDLTPDDVCLLYIDSHKGNTFIRELKLDKDGSLLSRWPSGFFEESYNEMFS